MSSVAAVVDHHGVLLGQDQAELPEGAVAAVAVPRHPELEAVALAASRGSARPALATCDRVASATQSSESSRAPSHRPRLQVELAERGDVLGGGVQAR